MFFIQIVTEKGFHLDIRLPSITSSLSVNRDRKSPSFRALLKNNSAVNGAAAATASASPMSPDSSKQCLFLQYLFDCLVVIKHDSVKYYPKTNQKDVLLHLSVTKPLPQVILQNITARVYITDLTRIHLELFNIIFMNNIPSAKLKCLNNNTYCQCILHFICRQFY